MNPDLPPADALPPTKRIRSNLRLRVIWGTIAAALLIGCTYGGPISFGLFFAAVQAVMLKEFYRIMRAGGYAPAKWIGIAAGTVLFIGTFWLAFDGFKSLDSWEDAISAITALISIETLWRGLAIALPVVLLIREILVWPRYAQPFANAAAVVFGIMYVSIPMTLLIVIAYGSGHYDPRRVFCLIVLVWAADTGAYFAGKNFGKHKLAPSISPGKTWEGWAGGALLALATGWAFGQFVPDIPLTHRLVAAGVVAVFGPLGDLAESMLKRSAGVKDSGTFLPGHGGLLDRFDAFLLVLPVLVLLQLLAG
ncbi:MAG: phosphatidate cytidylyltransferase [Janthinobacterium lividum]